MNRAFIIISQEDTPHILAYLSKSTNSFVSSATPCIVAAAAVNDELGLLQTLKQTAL